MTFFHFEGGTTENSNKLMIPHVNGIDYLDISLRFDMKMS